MKPGETVAEIGSGTGWFTGFMMLHYDSLNYYACDIDHYAVAALPHVTAKYLSIRETANSNTLSIVQGSVSASGLPEGIFDKIIVRETFHHFETPDAMLYDIRMLLKPAGQLFVYEPYTEASFYSRDCGSNIYSRDDLLKKFQAGGYTLRREITLTDSPGNTPSWCGKPGRKNGPKIIFIFSAGH